MESRRGSNNALIVYKKKRRKFALFVYSLIIFYLLFALLQWYLIWYLKETNKFFMNQYGWSIGAFVVALALTTAFIFVEDLRFLKPANWVISMLIVEGIILGLATLIVRQKEMDVVLQYVFTVSVMGVFIIAGSFIPHDLTMDVVILFVVAVLALIGSMFFLMLHLICNIPYTFLVYRIFITFAVVLFIMYHAQIINGSRFAEIRTIDILLGALILFYDFIILYLFTFIAGDKWSDPCDANGKKIYWGLNKKLVTPNGVTQPMNI